MEWFILLIGFVGIAYELSAVERAVTRAADALTAIEIDVERLRSYAESDAVQPPRSSR